MKDLLLAKLTPKTRILEPRRKRMRMVEHGGRETAAHGILHDVVDLSIELRSMAHAAIKPRCQ